MPLVLANRVQETGTANTTVSFTLTGAVTGFQSFAVIGNTNTTYYSATDGSGNWEVGLGTYSTTGPTLTRTTVYASSNSNLAVTFSGVVSVFVTLPSGSAVYEDASGNASPLGTITSGTWNASTIGVAYGGTGVTTSSGANSVVLRDANQNITINRLNQGLQTTTASGGTTTLTVASEFNQALVGTGGHTFRLPDATTLSATTAFQFNNNATGTLTIQNNAGTAVGTVAPGGAAGIALLSNGTVGGTWDVHAYIPENVTWGTNALALGSTAISGGTWQGGTITPAYGGTGLTSFTTNGAVYATGTATLTSGTLPVIAGGTGAVATPTNGQLLIGNGTNYSVASLGTGTGISTTTGSGTLTINNTGVTSLAGTSPVTASASTGSVTVSLASGYGDTQNPYASKTANFVLAAPSGLAGVPTFRAIVAADIPTLNQNTTGSAGSVANAVTFNNGGTGDISGTTFNGSAARTISYNTIGAPSTGGANATGTWGISISGNAATATTASNVNNGTLTLAVSGTGLSGSQTFTANQASNATFTVTSNATNLNTASTIVARDASGNFSAGTITATLSGSATSAGSVSNAVTFNNGGAGGASGSTFNGSGALTVSYNTVGAPSTTGTNASGTWGISISGNAATATSATSATSATTATTATTATNQSGGTVSATTGAFTSNLTSNFGYSNQDNALRIFAPGGASYATGSSTVTGAIKIRIPAAAKGSNTMISFKVKVYQYSAGLSGEFQISGYNYNDVAFTWYNVAATSLSQSLPDLTVRFGNDGTSQCVYIGDLASTWSYPQVVVTDLIAGYNAYTTAMWASGWSVSFESSAFAGVTNTITAARTINTANYTSYSPTLTGGGASGSWSINAATASNVAGLVQNSFTTYSNTATSIAKNGYFGLLLGNSTSHLNLMADGSGNGGIYREAWGWPMYWSVGNSCMGFGGSATTAGYVLQTNGSLNVVGAITSSGAITATGDITTYRSATPTTGVIYFGNTGTKYLYYDGANYSMPGGQLDVNGSRVLNAGNYTSYSPSLTGSGASGTWGISISGNAATATTASNVNNGTLTMNVSGVGLSGSQTFTANQSTAATFTVTSNATSANTASTIVARDASGNFTAGTITATLSGNASTATSATSATTATTATNLAGGAANQIHYNTAASTSAFITAPTTASTYLGWNGTAFAWSAPSASTTVTDDTITNATRYLTFTSATSGSITGVNVSSTKLTYNPSTGALSSTTVAGSSDERLKTNWRDLQADFIEQLATVKAGVYDRTDMDVPVTQVGVTAQALRPVLPDAVLEDVDGMLSVAYGNAALVAAVKLAQRVVEQEARINRLEALVTQLIGE